MFQFFSADTFGEKKIKWPTSETGSADGRLTFASERQEEKSGRMTSKVAKMKDGKKDRMRETG